jgi:hypothetical protein
MIALIACAAAVAGAAPVPRPAPPDEQERLLSRGKKFLKRGKVDLFVAATAGWKLKADDPRLWEPVVDLGRVLLRKGKMTGPRTPNGCPSSFEDYAALKRVVSLSFTRLNGPYTQRSQPEDGITFYKGGIQSRGVVADQGLWYSVVASRGDVHLTSGISESVVFANGNVKAEKIFKSIVVCDGDVEVGPLTVALVIARGNITAKRGASASTLVAGGKITLHNQEKRNLDGGHFIVVEEKDAKPLGFVTFFELHQVGLEVKAADKAVSVAKVVAKSAAEKAGLKVGDAILEVGGKRPDSAESLRRLLRDALAVGDAAVKLRRGDQTLTAKMSLPE